MMSPPPLFANAITSVRNSLLALSSRPGSANLKSIVLVSGAAFVTSALISDISIDAKAFGIKSVLLSPVRGAFSLPPLATVDIRPGDDLGGGSLLRLGSPVNDQGPRPARRTSGAHQGRKTLQAGEEVPRYGLARLRLDGEDRTAVFDDDVDFQPLTVTEKGEARW